MALLPFRTARFRCPETAPLQTPVHWPVGFRSLFFAEIDRAERIFSRGRCLSCFREGDGCKETGRDTTTFFSGWSLCGLPWRFFLFIFRLFHSEVAPQADTGLLSFCRGYRHHHDVASWNKTLCWVEAGAVFERPLHTA